MIFFHNWVAPSFYFSYPKYCHRIVKGSPLTSKT